MGSVVGSFEGDRDGILDGVIVGSVVGLVVGSKVGSVVGSNVGSLSLNNQRLHGISVKNVTGCRWFHAEGSMAAILVPMI